MLLLKGASTFWLTWPPPPPHNRKSGPEKMGTLPYITEHVLLRQSITVRGRSPGNTDLHVHLSFRPAVAPRPRNTYRCVSATEL
jgi:hypothetical protein